MCGLANHLFSLSILWLQSVVMLYVFYLFYPVRVVPSSVVNTYIVLCTTFTAYLLYLLYPTQLCSIPKGRRLAWAPHTYLLQYHPYSSSFVFYSFFIFFVETAFHLDDALRYKVRYACVPITFVLALGFGIHKGLLSSPFSYADIFGSLWCFLSVALGIIGVLHI